MPMTSEVFLTVLRVTDNLDELHATRELLLKEIAQVVSLQYHQSEADLVELSCDYQFLICRDLVIQEEKMTLGLNNSLAVYYMLVKLWIFV